MKILMFILIISIPLVSCSTTKENKKGNKKMKLGRNKLTYPKTPEKKTIKDYFGVKVIDNYSWLEDDNNLAVKEWIKKQNDFTLNYINKNLKDKIAEKYRKMFNYKKYSSLFKKGGYYFYFKNNGLQNQSVLYRTDNLEKEGDIIIDPNKFSDDGSISLGNIFINQDASLMVYSISESGKDNQTYYIKNLKTLKNYPEKLLYMRYTSIAWTDNGFYYGRYPDPKTVKKGEETLNHKIYFHIPGTPQKEDKLIYQEPQNPEYAFSPQITEDGKYLIIYVWKGTSPNTMIYYKNLKEKNSEIKKLFDKFDAFYDIIGNQDNTFYILTDKNAPNKRIFKIDINTKKEEEILNEDLKKTIDYAFLSNNSIFVNYMKDVHNEISIFDMTGKLTRNIKLPSIGTASIRGNQSNKEVFVTFTSFLYPGIIYYYDFDKDNLNEIFKTELNFNKNNYTVKQIFYKSKDGTKIPMFIVHKKGIKQNGNNPVILYGYGGFNVSLTPWFSTIRLLWMQNGGIFALANIRGGGEYGEKWHKAGILENKQNVFDDFIYAAKYLISNKYTNSSKLAIMGGSNGGLLVAAVTVQKPKLFGAVICQVPLTDMLKYHKFLVGHYWIPEYGNAENSKKEFEYLYKYSPYHNVKEDYYPSILITTADSDDRVAPLHARKFAAILQKRNKSYNPVLLRVKNKSGHGHGMSTKQIIDEQSDIYAFLFDIFGMEFR